MRIRKAALKDVKSCLSLSRQEGEHYWEAKDFKNCAADKAVLFIIAEEKGKVLGYSIGYVSPTKRIEGLIHETRVDNNHRGKNIGTKLVDELGKAFFKRKVKIIYAMIEPKLKPFYINSCKFKESGFWIETSKKKF